LTPHHRGATDLFHAQLADDPGRFTSCRACDAQGIKRCRFAGNGAYGTPASMHSAVAPVRSPSHERQMGVLTHPSGAITNSEGPRCALSRRPRVFKRPQQRRTTWDGHTHHQTPNRTQPTQRRSGMAASHIRDPLTAGAKVHRPRVPLSASLLYAAARLRTRINRVLRTLPDARLAPRGLGWAHC
jgi:hypothetical protein